MLGILKNRTLGNRNWGRELKSHSTWYSIPIVPNLTPYQGEGWRSDHRNTRVRRVKTRVLYPTRHTLENIDALLLLRLLQGAEEHVVRDNQRRMYAGGRETVEQSQTT